MGNERMSVVQRWLLSSTILSSATVFSVTGMRQCAEWGMGVVERVYRRLMGRLPWNPGIRGELVIFIDYGARGLDATIGSGGSIEQLSLLSY